VRVGRSAGPPVPAVTVYRTHDGGQTWDAPSPAPFGVDLDLDDPGFLAGSSFVSGTAGWLTANGAAYVTADAGLTWIRQGQLPGGLTFNGLTPVDQSVAVAVAAKSRAAGVPWSLFMTVDAGRTWRELTSPRA
jgi:photosystem II stability/assembly factor-like uncharacterized protein